MKKILTTLFAGSFLLAEAGILTVSNHSNSPGQYTNLQTAINAALPGDTLYVHGSTVSYGNVTVNKTLTFIGTGHNPNKPNPLVSEIGNLTLDSVSGVSGASGTRVAGFKLNRISGYAGSGGTKNVRIARNYFVSGGTKITVTGSGWIIENNIFYPSYITLNNNGNVMVRNNIFSGAYIFSSNKATVLIVNNVFLGFSPATALSTVSNALIANNIFMGSSPKGSSVNSNTFSNNITYQTANDTIPFGSNTGTGNLVAQNPMFTNLPINSFNYGYDFTLQPTSPGKNAGTDGTDIGVYGGISPFVDLTGSPAIPQMKYVTILNPVIQVGDSLKVNIKAKKQD